MEVLKALDYRVKSQLALCLLHRPKVRFLFCSSGYGQSLLFRVRHVKKTLSAFHSSGPIPKVHNGCQPLHQKYLLHHNLYCSTTNSDKKWNQTIYPSTCDISVYKIICILLNHSNYVLGNHRLPHCHLLGTACWLTDNSVTSGLWRLIAKDSGS